MNVSMEIHYKNIASWVIDFSVQRSLDTLLSRLVEESMYIVTAEQSRDDSAEKLLCLDNNIKLKQWLELLIIWCNSIFDKILFILIYQIFFQDIDIWFWVNINCNAQLSVEIFTVPSVFIYSLTICMC